MADLAPVLAVDATTEVCGVVVARGGRAVARAEVTTRAAHSELLVRLVSDALAYVGTRGSELSHLAVSRGPGSFTGIRVGLATARALALGWKRPVRTVTAFDAVVARVGGHAGTVAVLLDARRGQLYAAAFGADGSHAPPVVLDPEGIGGWAAEVGAVDLVAGSALATHGGAIRSAFPRAERRPDLLPSALGVALADADGRCGDELAPLYIRPPDARLPDPRP